MTGQGLVRDPGSVRRASPPPGADEIDLARRQIDPYAQARAPGDGVAVLDGRIVENLHVATARALIARAEAIAALSIAAGAV